LHKENVYIVMEVSSWINFTLKHMVENVHGIININLNFLKGDFYVLVWLFCSLLIGVCLLNFYFDFEYAVQEF